LNRLLDRFRGQVPFQRLKQDLAGGRREIPIFGLTGSGPALALALMLAEVRPLVVVAENNREAESLAADLQFYARCGGQPARLALLPASETDPYRGISPHPEISEQRSLALWNILHGQVDVVVTTGRAVMQRMIDPERFRQNAWNLEVGHEIPIDKLLEHLKLLGYVREDPVTDVGEFSHRGGIVDIYSPSAARPVRMEFFGDQIESLRQYDPASQRSLEFVNSVAIVPMKELWLISQEWEQWGEQAARFWADERFAEMLEERWTAARAGAEFGGFEYLAPLVLPIRSKLSDFIPAAVWALLEPTQLEKWWEEEWQRLLELYQDALADGELALPPESNFLSFEEFQKDAAGHRRVAFQELPVEDSDLQGSWAVDFHSAPADHFQGRIRDLVNRAEQAGREREGWLLVMHSQGMADRLHDILNEYGLVASRLQPETTDAQASAGTDLSSWPHGFFIAVGDLSCGFELPDGGLHVFSQEEIFGEPETRVQPRARREKSGVFISDFRDLKPGDFVVHIEHGVGQFQGLRKIGVGQTEREFVLLHYRDDAKLYVPAERLDLIQKYNTAGDKGPALERLGGGHWEKTKGRIKKSMRDMAEELLQLYARRKMVKGYAFHPDDELQREFEQSFEFTETPDQNAAILDVKRDMEAETPMDRLICGDVGYGKTEVAMRAAFKAVTDGKQVAVLAPTTLLAFQHLNTFRARMQAFPVRVEMVSRLRTQREQTEVIKAVEAGKVDILIGTHRLLSRDVQFLDLGLVVVDEEQRFGVAQKERLKKMRTETDVLTLSATPIPRTLNMSMIGLRDLSIIETPPKDRLSIQTVVARFSRHIIKSAIDLELARQGQVFVVHNRVESIYSIAEMIQQICPGSRVAVGHGQMDERKLEEVMMRFVHHEFDVLVATTIIENGLDIPRANTLVVDRADRYGLAQLYQLRGRVGRSNRRAYAYLLVPSERILTPVARKRLATIREFSDLGAGFKIAAMDMEIRGAGNLLGGEQHGHIQAIGFEFYMQLLERTMRELKGEDVAEDTPTSIDLKLDIRIPEHYIEDANQRLRVYKRISQARDEAQLEEIRLEISDQYGRHPKTLMNLFEYARLRMAAQRVRAISIDRRAGEVLIKFSDAAPVSPERLLELVAGRPGSSFSPGGVLRLPIDSERPSDLFELLHGSLENVAG